jgi:hypothetical protein
VKRHYRGQAVAGVLLALAGPGGAADQPWKVPTPKNLQVLDKGLSGRELVATMRSFTRALAVRCQHCHVYKGDDPDDLNTFDFASDEKPEKRTARAMLRMVAQINDEYFTGTGASGAPAEAKVTCYNCHRGERQPLTDRPAVQGTAEQRR